MMTKLKVLLVYSNRTMQNPPPMGLALLAGILRAHSVEMRLFDLSLYANEAGLYDDDRVRQLQVRPFDFRGCDAALLTSDPRDDFRALLTEFGPALVALSCNEATWLAGSELLGLVPPGPTVVVGGALATFAPELVLRHSRVDLVCVGEGEGALAELVDALAAGADPSGISNLWSRAGAAVRKNPLRLPVELDTLPFPDYDIFEPARFYRPMAGKVWRVLPLETSRGCPYPCRYCSSPAQRELYRAAERPYFRAKSIARLAAELADLVSRWQPEYLFFPSDVFLAGNDRWFEDFCRMYERYRLPFYCQFRAETVSPARMRRLKEIGCHRLTMGVQHGNEAFRRQLTGTTLANEKMIRAAEMIAAADIPLSIDCIIGFPDETRELAFDTIRLVRQMPFDTVSAFTFMPFHGTELHAECVRRGYIDPATIVSDFSRGTLLHMPQFPPAEIDGLVKTFALYAGLPESDFSEIGKAEGEGPEADRIFRELRVRYIQTKLTASPS